MVLINIINRIKFKLVNYRICNRVGQIEFLLCPNQIIIQQLELNHYPMLSSLHAENDLRLYALTSTSLFFFFMPSYRIFANL